MENIRVMSLNSIKTLNLLVAMLSGWFALFAAKRGKTLLLERVFKESKRVFDIPKFTLYAAADGVFEILKRDSTGIAFAFRKKRIRSAHTA